MPRKKMILGKTFNKLESFIIFIKWVRVNEIILNGLF